MKVLGITGGIGCGKSFILKQLKDDYGAYIIETDSLAHSLMKKGQIIYDAIVKEFGEEILSLDGEIDREKLGKIVFSDKDKLKKLNSISHPLVKQYILDDIQKKRALNTKLYVIEAALLIQDGYKTICDQIWYIWASEETRINRLMSNRGYSLEKCKQVIKNQENEDYYRKYTNYTINNEKSIEDSSKQLKVLLNKFL